MMRFLPVNKQHLILHRAGMKLTAVVSDFDSVDKESFAECGSELVVLPVKKDMTDSSALYFYARKLYPQANFVLYNSFDQRIDHALSLFSLFDSDASLTIKTPCTKIMCYLPGNHQIVYQPEYKYISFIAMVEVTDIVLQNFVYPLTRKKLKIFSDLTVSNEFIKQQQGEGGWLSFATGKILVIYAKDIPCVK